MAANQPTILVIEDDPAIRRFLRASLTESGFDISEAETAEHGLRKAGLQKPDLVILDLGLPDRDGLTVISALRESSSVPILVLSARGRELDKVAALDAGADDYLTKPFGVPELLARIRVALRHAARIGHGDPGEPSIVTLGDLRVDLAARSVTVRGTAVHLTRLEFELLKTFVENAGKVLTHRLLLKEVWGPHAVQETHTLRVFVANLRRKIEDDSANPRYLLTEQGVGYRLASDPE